MCVGGLPFHAAAMLETILKLELKRCVVMHEFAQAKSSLYRVHLTYEQAISLQSHFHVLNFLVLTVFHLLLLLRSRFPSYHQVWSHTPSILVRLPRS